MPQWRLINPTKNKTDKKITKELNKQLQNALNPKSTIEKQNGDRVFRIGDRVMQVKNNYDIYWEKKTNSTLEAGSGIFNGELGIITEIDEVNKQIEVCFDDEKVAFEYCFTGEGTLQRGSGKCYIAGHYGLFFYPAAACTDCIIVGNGEIDLRNGR